MDNDKHVYTKKDLKYTPRSEEELEKILNLLNDPNFKNEPVRYDLIHHGVAEATKNTWKRIAHQGGNIFDSTAHPD